jgi:hypothetical protein
LEAYFFFFFPAFFFMVVFFAAFFAFIVCPSDDVSRPNRARAVSMWKFSRESTNAFFR